MTRDEAPPKNRKEILQRLFNRAIRTSFNVWKDACKGEEEEGEGRGGSGADNDQMLRQIEKTHAMQVGMHEACLAEIRALGEQVTKMTHDLTAVTAVVSQLCHALPAPSFMSGGGEVGGVVGRGAGAGGGGAVGMAFGSEASLPEASSELSATESFGHRRPLGPEGAVAEKEQPYDPARLTSPRVISPRHLTSRRAPAPASARAGSATAEALSHAHPVGPRQRAIPGADNVLVAHSLRNRSPRGAHTRTRTARSASSYDVDDVILPEIKFVDDLRAAGGVGRPSVRELERRHLVSAHVGEREPTRAFRQSAAWLDTLQSYSGTRGGTEEGEGAGGGGGRGGDGGGAVKSGGGTDWVNDLKGQLNSGGDTTSEALKIVTSLEQRMMDASARLEQRQLGQVDTGLGTQEWRDGPGKVTPIKEARNGSQLRSDSYQQRGRTPSNGVRVSARIFLCARVREASSEYLLAWGERGGGGGGGGTLYGEEIGLSCVATANNSSSERLSHLDRTQPSPPARTAYL